MILAGRVGHDAQDTYSPPHIQGTFEVVRGPQSFVLQQGQGAKKKCWTHRQDMEHEVASIPTFAGPSGVSHAQDQGKPIICRRC